MSTRAILAYPYRDGYKGAWVWSDGMPSSMKPILKLSADSAKKAKFLVQLGNISALLTKQDLALLAKGFPDTQWVHCKVFKSKEALNMFLDKNMQYKSNWYAELRSGLCLLGDKTMEEVQTISRNAVYFVTEIGESNYAIQQLHNIQFKPNDSVHYVYYPNIQEMLNQDINYVYVYNVEKNTWRMHQ